MSIIILCIEIFFARILDVSLGTIRTVIVVKGKNLLGSILGFMEVTIWFLVAQKALDLASENIFVIISYSLGFATGTYIGGIISKKYIQTKVQVQIVTSKNINKLVSDLKENGFAITVMKIESNESKYMLFLELDSKYLEKLKNIIRKYDKKAFIVVNETVYVQNGYFGVRK